ncbi:MSCRAMM family protein [Alkalihalobacillus pseudalcaliphilus]|uniref:MSCRAMM family protein n=1 Tax=Alkalihalobacillus pseudalcaliphilus TaxID=79884 RepID=UPI00064DEE06|nr:SpaA isopeptide-forming pilin-related protein [Alkalihalobacillus pseudalcaliphilus]KMK78013.1 hypothetical protein AB990_00740 [Alkalihalobacillus pseudalcaliphilus]
MKDYWPYKKKKVIGQGKNRFSQKCKSKKPRSKCHSMNLRLPFTFTKVDSSTNLPLGGALFRLVDQYGDVQEEVSDSSGRVRFLLQIEMIYHLMEVTPPLGYTPNRQMYKVRIDRFGVTWVNNFQSNELVIPNSPGQPGIVGEFTALKRMYTSLSPLPGAIYTLYQEGIPVDQATSSRLGEVNFSHLAPGSYELIETGIPAGYRPFEPSYLVEVATSGEVTINGEEADGFLLFNMEEAELNFEKLSFPDISPLSGALFELLDSSGTVINTQISDPLVNFAIVEPGNYTLVESNAPPSYVDNQTSYDVFVSPFGYITIDGFPLANYQFGNSTGQLLLQLAESETYRPLQDVVFEIARQDGTVIGTFTTNSSGFIEQALPDGEYRVRQVSALPGYQIDPVTYMIEVNGGVVTSINGVSPDNGGLLVQNKPTIQGQIITSYVDEDGRSLAADTVQIENGQYVITPDQLLEIPGYTLIGLVPESAPLVGISYPDTPTQIQFLYRVNP